MTVSPRRGPGGIAISSLFAGVALGLGLGLQLVVGGQPGLALRLAGLGRHAHPLELALERAAAGDVRLLLQREARLLLLQPARVVALERDALAVVELEDPLGDVVEEVAVVGDRDDGAGVVLQEPFEPEHRLGVEVVGRLVEQQQVGACQQQTAQRDPALLATRQRWSRRQSSGGQRSASIAMSTLRSRLQASAAAILSSSTACASPILS